MIPKLNPERAVWCHARVSEMTPGYKMKRWARHSLKGFIAMECLVPARNGQSLAILDYIHNNTVYLLTVSVHGSM